MDQELAKIRGRIDLLDRRLAALLARRFGLALGIARRGLKRRIQDPVRERAILKASAAAAGAAFAPPVRAVFTEILRQSRKLQAARK